MSKRLSDIFIIHTKNIQRLFFVRKINLSRLYFIQVRKIALYTSFLGLFIVYYASLTPWFLWSIHKYYVFFALVPLLLGMLMSRQLKQPIFNRKDYLYPLIACILLQLTMALTSRKNINGVLMVVFSSMIYMSLFRMEIKELKRLSNYLTTSMACILVISIPFYIIHLLGVHLPHFHTAPADLDYSFENYYFFLVDDRFAFEFIPRFHSIFLEPSHLGMACISLLYSQIGNWNKLSCKILFVGIFMTFSVAAYICLILLFFSSAWMKGKAILGKILLILTLCVITIITSLIYNKGNNLVNQLIVQRLTLNTEGKIEGDNRTTAIFTKEYNKLASSEEIIIGKGMEKFLRFGNNGNSGFRVYIYCYGLLSILMLIIFFITLFRTSTNRRAVVSMTLISIASFIAHGTPILYYFFIPLYILLFNETTPQKKLTKTQ